MCGVGEKADRRPIDPAPIIQLRVITHDRPLLKSEKMSKEDDVEANFGMRTSSLHPPAKEPLRDDRGSTINTPQQKGGEAHTATHSSLFKRGKLVRTDWGDGWEDKAWYLENPHYFMYAMLADPEKDEELHLLKDFNALGGGHRAVGTLRPGRV